MTTDSVRPAAVRVDTSSGEAIGIPEGRSLVFGRGPDADLTIAAGRELSRRAGVISAVEGGVWVANLSCTHALYAVTNGSSTRLPRIEEGAEPSEGWFVRSGTVLVGSRAMVVDGEALRVTVCGPAGRLPGPDGAGALVPAPGDSTLLPLYLDPNTKLFLVALMWCRPWLVDNTRTTPLPRTPEIARAALETTGAHYELERFETQPAFRDRLSARVGEHLKVLRHKIAARGLVREGTRLSDEVVVNVLIEHAVVVPADLRRLNDPAWCSRQEDLWWTRRP